MAQRSFPSKRRLITLVAISAPIGLGLGVVICELTWEAPAVAIPEMCVRAYPDEDVTVSHGACEPEPAYY